MAVINGITVRELVKQREIVAAEVDKEQKEVVPEMATFSAAAKRAEIPE